MAISNASDSATTQLVNNALQSSYTYLTQFANSEDFLVKIQTVFGDSFDAAKLEDLRQQWGSGNFDSIPNIEIRAGAELQGANAAYAGSTNTIYVSQDFLNQYAGNTQVVSAVLIEEIGHSVDSQINTTDTPGDEGELFSAIVRGVDLSQDQILQMKQENDFIVLNVKSDSTDLNLSGSSLPVEQSGEYSSTHPITPSLINTLLVFGKNPPSTPDYNPHIRNDNETTDSISYDMNDYMKNGGGKYAYSALFPVVKEFFNSTYSFEDREYTDSEIKALLGLNNEDDYYANVSQYSTGIGSAEWLYRSFFFGSTSFKLSSVEFYVSDTGVKTIKSMTIIPIEKKTGISRDNYDFETTDTYAKLFNDKVLQPLYDPYNLRLADKPVYINFVGQVTPIYNYDQSDFNADIIKSKNDTYELSSFSEYLTETAPFI
jgi:hypothetical protein